MLIGLDCVPPELAFERFGHVMPQLSALRARGVSGPLRSTFPPITVPAWAALTSGRDPGELGVYGFRKRVPGSYGLALSDARDVSAPRLWDVAARAGKRSSVLFVPPSYPVQPVTGQAVGCFLTPEDADVWTHPRALAGELVSELGPYVPDVDVRHADRRDLFARLCALTRQSFAIARHVWTTRAPELLVMVDIAPDRLHHAFLDVIDPRHPRHDPRGPDAELGARYYALLDREIGSLCALADEHTAVLVASDHGAQPLAGCFLVNAWLVQHGYLTLRAPLDGPRPLTPELVDWSRTRAWAEGGYYARVFLNRQGREPAGIVAEHTCAALLAELRQGLSAVTGPAGERWDNLVAPPGELYGAVRGFAPDLCAAFDGLRVRALSTVGSGALYADRDDRGPDVANHSMHGIFVAAGPGVSARGALTEAVIYDVGATALALLGVDQPAGWRGVDRSGAS
jgi:predicted AlkP superfamily phosphohydrolase/phosphomutase